MSVIRRCAAADVPTVMQFIDEHWSRGHVLSTSRRLMDWQYADHADAGQYNWFIGEDSQGIQGVLGFIPTWRYDAELGSDPVIWLALWKVRQTPANTGLGLQLLAAVSRWRPDAAIAVQGINAKHPPMYRALGFRVGEQTQHFVCNPDLPQTILSAPAGFALPVPLAGRAVWRPIHKDALAEQPPPVATTPRKTGCYFARRFFDHPVYAYRVFAVHLDGRLVGLVATRVATHGTSSVLRIVDYAGTEDGLSESGSAIAGQLAEVACEYADFWQFGFPDAVVERAGFRTVAPGGDVVVPNYFEPFLQRNGRIEFAIKFAAGAAGAPLALCRADGDQDRPNMIPVSNET